MGFNAVVVERDADGQDPRRRPRARARRSPRRRGHRRRRLFDAELQGRPLPRPGRRPGAQVSARPGHRLRRPGRGFVRSALPARRRGGADRLARRRGALGRLRPEGAGPRRLAGAAARGADACARHGDRHRRPHRDAGDPRARGPRPRAPPRPGAGHRRRRRRRLGRGGAARPARLRGGRGHRPPGEPSPTCAGSAPRGSSRAPISPSRSPAASNPRPGPARSTPSAARCCRG